MKQLLTVALSWFFLHAVYADEITKITGYAPKYVGKQVDIYQIMDYISMRQERIASATVGEDSTFTCNFYLKETQKLVITSNNNSGFIFAAPGRSYNVYMPDRNPYDPYRPLGNKIELTFLDLDSNDVNYKMLTFNRWADEMIARYYTKNNAESPYFAKRLETFKSDVAAYYKNDTNDLFFRTHIRYSIARLDNMYFMGSRNRYEKYDFYLRNSPVYYQNESYMEYVNTYYSKLLTNISHEINNRVYLALLKSSPTLIMNALSTEYTLKGNVRLRELVMIKVLSEAYYQNDFPQTNIMTVLDSVSRFAFFDEHKMVAQNIMFRLSELTQGSKAPDFTLTDASGMYDLKRFSGKHLYLFFVNPSSPESVKQIELLKPIYQRYVQHVNFLMIIRDDGKDAQTVESIRKSVPWNSVAVAPENEVYKRYQIINMPYYILIDPVGYIVTAPALGPLPNGQYETIDKTFFQIKKAIESGTGDGR